MNRFTPGTDELVHDLVIVGGGIHGASMSYTAALNGLDTVLLERDDFAAKSSANSQKVIHGGLRYLQRLDIKRVIESIREKQRYYFLFPHLVKPLPCILPTSGYCTGGNEAFRAAFLMYKMIVKVVCRGKLTAHLDKRPRLLAKQQVNRHFPHIAAENMRGGALWYDGLCVEPERVILSLLKGASMRGAGISNYTEVTSIKRVDDKTLSVLVYDHLRQQSFQLRARKVALCTGPDFKDDLGPGKVPAKLGEMTLIRGMNVILPPLFKSNASFAAKLRRGRESRFLFIVPWKKYSIGGTHWQECDDRTAVWSEKEQVKDSFRQLMQQAVPGRDVFPEILSEHVGFVPGRRRSTSDQSAAEQILAHFRLIDREEARRGDVLQVVGVKFTTAFDVALKGLRRLFPGAAVQDVLQFSALPWGSPADKPEKLMARYILRYQQLLTERQLEQLFSLTGSDLPRVVEKYLRPLQQKSQPLTDTAIYSGLTSFFIKEEMAVHLDDLIYRRLFPDTPVLPSMDLLVTLAGCMAELLLWSAEQKDSELERVVDLRKTAI
jgi:glycerol-3-phosphate dehydrogenase